MKNKKSILLLIAIMLLVAQTRVQAQTDKSFDKHEVNLGVGVLSSNQISGFLKDIIMDFVLNITSSGKITRENRSYSATWHAGYKYSLSKRWAIGAEFAYYGSSSDILVSGYKFGRLSDNYYTLALEMDFKYINKDDFKFYSTLGIGGTQFKQNLEVDINLLPQIPIPITIEQETYSQMRFNYQFTLIGLKFGKTFGGYAELGIGYKGILNGGLF
jgi:opacity protein-like surface antigen